MCIICGNTTVLVPEEDWSISPWIFSLFFFGNNSVHRIIVLVWMYAGTCCGFDHMFCLLKRCKYSLYSDTMFHFGSTNPCRITRKVEQTKMYICTLEEFILVDVVTLLYKLELNMHWKCCSLYTIATIEEKGWDCSQMYNWHCRLNRITMKWESVTYEN